jgi:hypothetical protein
MLSGLLMTMDYSGLYIIIRDYRNKPVSNKIKLNKPE